MSDYTDVKKSRNRKNITTIITQNKKDETDKLYDTDDNIEKIKDKESEDKNEINLSKINIPKIIHQTWKDENVPDKWKESPESWKKFFPDWDYKLWTDKEMRKFIEKEYNWFLKYYDSYKYNIQRVDSFRYFCLYHYGGLYTDLDICCENNFEFLFEMVDAEVYLPKTPNIESYTNCIMASKAKAEFWKTMFMVLEERHNKYWYSSYISIIFSTGPQALTEAVNRYICPICVLPRSIISQSINDPNKKNNLYTKALTGASWHNLEAIVVTKTYKNWKKIVIFFIVLIIYWIYLFFEYRNFYFLIKNL